MAKFYVEKGANAAGEFVVHNETCTSLPDKEKLLYLGSRSNAAAPLNEAGLYQCSPSAPCPECITS